MKYRDGYKNVIFEDIEFDVPIFPPRDITSEYVDLTMDGVLRVKRNFAFDGPSGPTFEKLFPWWYRNTITPATAHDALYSLMRDGFLSGANRKKADQVLRDMMIERGVSKLRANFWYRAVQAGAGHSADPSHKRKIKEAP